MSKLHPGVHVACRITQKMRSHTKSIPSLKLAADEEGETGSASLTEASPVMMGPLDLLAQEGIAFGPSYTC